MILITGASGSVGGTVLKTVVASGAVVSAMYRSDDDARGSSTLGKAVIADFADKNSLRRAFKDVESLFLVCSPIPQLVELESNAIEVAKETGVKHLVLNSSLGAGKWNTSFPKWHTEVEHVLERSGLPYSIVRPNSFMQNITAFFAQTIQTQDAFYSSMGQSRVSLIDVQDIADVVVALLVSSQPENKAYELNGPEALTYSNIADRISRICGRTIGYVDIPISEQKKAMLNAGMPEWQAQALLDLQEYYLQGNGGELNDDVQRITGHPPRNFDQFLTANASAFSKRAAIA